MVRVTLSFSCNLSFHVQFGFEILPSCCALHCCSLRVDFYSQSSRSFRKEHRFEEVIREPENGEGDAAAAARRESTPATDDNSSEHLSGDEEASSGGAPMEEGSGDEGDDSARLRRSARKG
jgi:hypothetical protein